MKIAQICPYDIDRPGGVQMHVRDTARAFEELGHEVVIIAPKVGAAADLPSQTASHRGPEIIRLGGAQIITFGETSFEISVARGAQHDILKALLQDGGFDVAHFHTPWVPVLPLQALRLCHVPKVVTFHNATPRTAEGLFLRVLFRSLSRMMIAQFGGVIAVSDAPLEHVRPAPGQVVQFVPPCSDLSRFRGEVAPQPGFADGKVNLLFLNRLEKRKGALQLLQAYKILAGEKLPVRLLIAGAGEEEAAMRAYAAAHALPDVVFAGRIEPADTPSWYATADIFCAPAPHGETFGIVIAEAMASGKPVVAAANLGYRTLMTGRAADFLTPPNDTVAMAAALKRLILDAALRQDMGAWGREHALQYDSRTVAPRLIGIYEQAIAKARQASNGDLSG